MSVIPTMSAQGENSWGMFAGPNSLHLNEVPEVINMPGGDFLDAVLKYDDEPEVAAYAESLLDIPRQTDADTAADSTEGQPSITHGADGVASANRSPRQWLSIAKRAGQIAVATAAVSPLNEIARVAAVGASFAASHSPEVGALAAGGSTTVIELVGALASASLIGTETGSRFFNWLNRRLASAMPKKLTPFSKATATFLGGSTVGMSIEQIENPDRTVQQNRRYGVLASVALGAVIAPLGAVGFPAASAAIANPEISGPAAGGAILFEVGRRAISKWRQRSAERKDMQRWRDSDKNCDYRLVNSAVELSNAAEIEQSVWDEKGFGNLDEEGYAKYIAKSRTFAAFDKTGKCVGVNRMFGGTDGILPPFLGMSFYDEAVQAKLKMSAMRGDLEELGTVAVVPGLRGKMVNAHLWRLAYRDAVDRGVKQWGIIMEPERVESMNKGYGFAFEQLGGVEDYQGGDCAAFVMNLEEAAHQMRHKKPAQYLWFTRLPLNS